MHWHQTYLQRKVGEKDVIFEIDILAAVRGIEPGMTGLEARTLGLYNGATLTF